MGAKNAYFCVYMALIATFACQAPLIILPIQIYNVVNTFVEALNVVCVYQKESEDFGNIFRNTLKKVYIGIILGTGITTLQSMIEVKVVAMTLNIILLACHMGGLFYINETLNNFNIQKEQFNDQNNILLKTDSEQSELKKNQDARWLEIYSHPLQLSKKKYYETLKLVRGNDHFMENFVDPIVKKKEFQFFDDTVNNNADEMLSEDEHEKTQLSYSDKQMD